MYLTIDVRFIGRWLRAQERQQTGLCDEARMTLRLLRHI
jgi:hypothetical protein